jgi:hypothetical protein
MKHSTNIVGSLFLIVAIGCDGGSPAPQPVKKPSVLSGLPAEMSVKQRSTTDVPGSDSALRLTIDDITGGQVLTSLSDKQGGTVLAVTSLKPGEAATFQLGDESFQLTLTELKNALVGEDFATFVVASGSAEETGDKKEEIERLLALVGSAEGTVFIRNGEEHSAKDAAEHLRRKWQAAGGEIATAEEFIDKIATKSSLSGEPYRVRRSDGTEVPASEYLREKLKELEQAP